MVAVFVAPEIFELRPDFVCLVLAVDGLPRGGSSDYSRRLLTEVSKDALERNLGTHPHIEAWHEALGS